MRRSACPFMQMETGTRMPYDGFFTMKLRATTTDMPGSTIAIRRYNKYYYNFWSGVYVERAPEGRSPPGLAASRLP